MTQRSKDLVLSAGLCVLALIVYWSAQAIPPSLLDTRFGAGLLPTGLAVVLGVLAILLFVGTLMQPKQQSEKVSGMTLAVAMPAILLAASLAAYILALQSGYFPFIPLTTVYLFLATMILVTFDLKIVLLAGLGSCVAAFLTQYIFVEIFSVFMP